MPIITVPANFGFSKINSFKLQRSTNILRSKYTGQGQVISFPYAVWMLKANLIEYDGLKAGQIRSFFIQLEGQKNTFRLPVPGFIKPMTNYAGNALTNGAVAARSTSMAIDGLVASSSVVAEGDYFTVQDELKIVTQAGASNGAGQMTINFMPPTRKAIADNIAVTFQNPTCLMRAADDDVANWGVMPPIRQQQNFEAIEAVDI